MKLENIWERVKNAAHPPPLPRPASEALATLPEPFKSTLVGMYANQPQRGFRDKLYVMDGATRIQPDQGMWLHELCRQLKPKQTVEIGLGYGFSTDYFLAAIHRNGAGKHVAIDPFQDHWNGIGQYQSESLSMNQAFRHISEKSSIGLQSLAQANEQFELIFIDGSHHFDDALIDFTLSADLCPMGGYIVLDDMWMPAIRRAVSFVRSNRTDFREMKTPIANIAAFKRVEKEARAWDHYVDF